MALARLVGGQDSNLQPKRYGLSPARATINAFSHVIDPKARISERVSVLGYVHTALPFALRALKTNNIFVTRGHKPNMPRLRDLFHNRQEP
jgi:hypothetical protein